MSDTPTVLKSKHGDVDVHCAFTRIVKTKDVVPYPKNANQHSAHQIELLAKLIGGDGKKKGHGWRLPITVSNQSGFVVRGHGRLEVAKKIGMKEVPVDFQDYESEEMEKADRLADNQIPELAEIDEAMLKGEFEDLMAADFEMDLTGFESSEIDEVLAFGVGSGDGRPPEKEIPKSIALLEKWKVETGQIWELGDHLMICGDCRDVIGGGLGKVDLVLTDPPYGVNKAEWDNDYPRWLCDTAFSVANTVAIMPGIWALPLCLADFGKRYKWILCGYNTNGMTFGAIGYSNWIPCVVGGKIPRTGQDAFSFVVGQGEKPDHPTPKPRTFIEYLIKRLSPNRSDIILDPFAGSGTTLIAAEQLGRKCTAIEIDIGYCSVILERWSEYTNCTPALQGGKHKSNKKG